MAWPGRPVRSSPRSPTLEPLGRAHSPSQYSRIANPVQDIGAGPSEYLLRGMAKESLCCMIPETDLARLADGKDRIRCIFEKGEQFCFQQVPL